MKKLLLSLIVLLLMGCAVTTTITDPVGKTWTVQSKSDAVVSIEKEGVKVSVDNRGRMGAFESILGIVAGKTELNLSNQPGQQ